MDTQFAWIYCHIDAPEDTHGTLIGQCERLETYAAQMHFTVVGSSQDLGGGLNSDRPGLRAALKAAKAGIFQVLLVDSVRCMGQDEASIKTFAKTLMPYGINFFLTLEGKILM